MAEKPANRRFNEGTYTQLLGWSTTRKLDSDELGPSIEFRNSLEQARGDGWRRTARCLSERLR